MRLLVNDQMGWHGWGQRQDEFADGIPAATPAPTLCSHSW